jgi:two-component system LytT family response regulator
MEARKDYLKIYTPSKEYITHMTMKYIQSILPASFIRIHRSYIIAKDKVTRISRTSIEISGNHQFPIGESYREAVQKNF